jgi:hypothetical protein
VGDIMERLSFVIPLLVLWLISYKICILNLQELCFISIIFHLLFDF